VVEVLGVPDLVAEIGEQLAWLGAALRTSPSNKRVVYCVPFIEPITVDAPQNTESITKSLQCDIKFRFEDCEDTLQVTNGQCWHALFRTSVIVRGFPIPRKPQWETGLEIPLNVLAALTRTRYIDTFNSKIFVKGFSSMLVPTKRFGDTLIWHLLYNDRYDDRISYLDCGVEHTDIQIPDLERVRHVVGWCSEAVYNVGMC
jgi:hypothetical protein